MTHLFVHIGPQNVPDFSDLITCTLCPQAFVEMKDVDELVVTKCLVLIVCIEDYENEVHPKLGDLPATQHDKANLLSLFEDECKFKVMRNDDTKRVDRKSFRKLIHQAQGELLTNYAKYHAFIFAFSGHGDANNILLSDGSTKDRTELHQDFDGGSCPDFGGRLKLFILDACQGSAVAPTQKEQRAKGTQLVGGGHVDSNTIILNGNTPGYLSFEQQGKGGALIRAFSYVLRTIKDMEDWNSMSMRIGRAMVSLTGSAQAVDKRELGILFRIYFTKPVAVDLARVPGWMHAKNSQTKQSQTEESQAKDSQAKDKDSQTKESPAEESQTKDAQAKDSQAKTSQGSKVATEWQLTATITQAGLLVVAETGTGEKWQMTYAAGSFQGESLEVVKKEIDAVKEQAAGRFKMPAGGVAFEATVAGYLLKLNHVE